MPLPSMHFARQFAGVVIASLFPVVLTAFLTIPMNLGGHPGEARPVDAQRFGHPT